MAIYYFAVDESAEEVLRPDKHCGNKFPGICHPLNYFPQVVMMANCRGSSFKIVNDCEYENFEGKIDCTEKYHKEYFEIYEWAKKFYKEQKGLVNG